MQQSTCVNCRSNKNAFEVAGEVNNKSNRCTEGKHQTEDFKDLPENRFWDT